MDYEKKYNEVLEKAKEFYSSDVASPARKQWLEKVFPELADSEDERIRTEIIRYLGPGCHAVSQKIVDTWIAWLEKQKEDTEPASQDLSEEIERISKRYPEVSFAKLSRIAVHFTKWQKKQSPTEWSGEDMKKIIFLKSLIEQNVPDSTFAVGGGAKYGVVTKAEAIEMLDSLTPHSHWKPSCEQMEALGDCILSTDEGSDAEKVLTSLYSKLLNLL